MVGKDISQSITSDGSKCSVQFDFWAGTTKTKNLDESIGSLNVELSQQDLEEIVGSLPVDEVAGLRTYESMYHKSWIFADTPHK